MELDSLAAYSAMAQNLFTGEGVTKNIDEAIRLFTYAANNGSSYAANRLGGIYQYGEEVEKDYKKALEFYKLAASYGNKYAFNNLGIMYHYGLGVEKNYEISNHYYEIAASKFNNEYAMYMTLFFASVPGALFSQDLWAIPILWMFFGLSVSKIFVAESKSKIIYTPSK